MLLRLPSVALAAFVISGLAAPAAALTVVLTPAQSSPRPVGSTITWTATVTDSTTGNPLSYRFEVAEPGSSQFSLVRDFSTTRILNWTRIDGEGIWRIRVTARDYLAGVTAQQTVSFQLTSRVVANQATVNPTDHPLMALFSAPACPSGSVMRVAFHLEGSSSTSYTDWKRCRSTSMNFYIAGMYPASIYSMNYEIGTGSTITPDPNEVTFITGVIPSNVPIPAAQITVPPGARTDTSLGVLLTAYVPMPSLSTAFPLGVPLATDLNGNVLWYYANLAQVTRMLPGGNMLGILSGFGTGTGPWGNVTLQQVIREFDLEGNTVRETNADRISEQLMAMGTDPIGRFNHDIIRLPNGKTLLFGDVQRIFPAGTQGSALPVDILGLMIVELDQNWQVTGYWNAFDHAGGGSQLDINRAALRGEVCFPGQLGCPPVLIGPYARDWLHANSVQYLSDGDLLVSLRDQDWIIKIDYNNGRGTGDILWRLGQDGDFTMLSSDPWPWFSAQHEAAFEDDGTTLSVFDNGTARVIQFPSQNSRGQVLVIDQEARTAMLQLNADLGVFGIMLGSAQRLNNGNYMFQPGFIGPLSDVSEQAIEVTPNGAVVHQYESHAQSYRSWRMADLYTPPPS